MGKMQRRKGHSYERQFAAWFRERWEALGVTAKRGWQSRGGGKEEADVETFLNGEPLPFHWELCRAKKPSVWAKYKQAQDDCDEGEIPIVVVRRDREEARVFLSLTDFEVFIDLFIKKKLEEQKEGV